MHELKQLIFHHSLMSILILGKNSRFWRPRLVGKNGHHIQEIQREYNVTISIRQRVQETQIIMQDDLGGTPRRIPCCEFLQDRINEIKQRGENI